MKREHAEPKSTGAVEPGDGGQMSWKVSMVEARMNHQPDGAPKMILPPPARAGMKGWIDPGGLNDELLRIMRGFDAQYYHSESEESRRTEISRPHVHNLHVEPVVLTVPLVARWCDGSRVRLVPLLEVALKKWS